MNFRVFHKEGDFRIEASATKKDIIKNHHHFKACIYKKNKLLWEGVIWSWALAAEEYTILEQDFEEKYSRVIQNAMNERKIFDHIARCWRVRKKDALKNALMEVVELT